MLVLSRKIGESVHIAGDIRVTVKDVRGGRVQLCIEAPASIRVVRKEVVDNQMQVSDSRGLTPTSEPASSDGTASSSESRQDS